MKARRWLAALSLLLGTSLLASCQPQQTTQNSDASLVSGTSQAASEEQPEQNDEDVSVVSPAIDRTAWNMILVNAKQPLPKNFTVETRQTKMELKFDARAADALEQMFADGQKAGLNLVPRSAYREHSYQKFLHQRKIEQYLEQGYSQDQAYQTASAIVAIPGTSEHETGLAADIYNSWQGSLEQTFDQSKEFQWLYEHCAEYGFILRYPKDKEQITGIVYEPWHYRYVGVEHARAIMEAGICLEEYLGAV